MSNYITNVITAPAHVLKALIGPVEEELRVDFAKIIPEPENIEKGSCSGTHPDGVVCWYNWRINNWGTKWNATYPCFRNDFNLPENLDELTQLSFDTAWDHPFPIIEKLSTMFPDDQISVKYADEDLGHNLGEYNIKNGEIVENRDFSEGNEEALDFASQVKFGKSYADFKSETEEA